MDDKKEKAFAHFDTVKAALDRQQAAITALAATADTTAIQVEHTTLHQNLHDAWTDLCAEEGWTEEVGEANRSGGEDKPPKTEEPKAPGDGG